MFKAATFKGGFVGLESWYCIRKMLAFLLKPLRKWYDTVAKRYSYKSGSVINWGRPSPHSVDIFGI